jgi:hypothetical protein
MEGEKELKKCIPRTINRGVFSSFIYLSLYFSYSSFLLMHFSKRKAENKPKLYPR